MSNVEAVLLYFGNSRPMKLMHRFSRLPNWMQVMVREDMETAFENRIKVLERIVKRGI